MKILGERKAREAYRHFGPAPGVPHSHTKYDLILLASIVTRLTEFSCSQALRQVKGKEVREGQGSQKEQGIQGLSITGFYCCGLVIKMLLDDSHLNVLLWDGNIVHYVIWMAWRQK